MKQWPKEDALHPTDRESGQCPICYSEGYEDALTAIRQHIASLPEQEETEWVKELRRIVNGIE